MKEIPQRASRPLRDFSLSLSNCQAIRSKKLRIYTSSVSDFQMLFSIQSSPILHTVGLDIVVGVGGLHDLEVAPVRAVQVG